MIRYRYFFQFAGLVALLAAFGLLPGRAAKNLTDSPAAHGPRLELVVFEADQCGYCELFRRNIAPGYTLAPLAAAAPLRFVDIGKADLDRMGLAAKLEVLPTTVLMKDGHEVERITGLTSPATYYVLLKHMIAKNTD